MVKIVFIDFDGTLYSHAKNCIPASAVEALNLLHNKGIKIFLCTGRSICEMKYFDTSMIHIDGMIATNGQAVYDESNNLIFDHPIDGEVKDLIIDLYNKNTVPMFINAGDNMFMNYVSDAVIKTQKEINSPIPPVKKYENEKFYMVSAFYNNKENWDELFKLQDIANITYWHNGAVDIVPKTSSKAIGIKEVLDYYHLNREDTMAFGDSDNDIEMLEYCNISVAVGNSTEKIKEAADYVTSDIDDDGIYNALKHYELI